ncbi:hypothetical protein LF41_314 [Lysobacter dokdonensis DS-58]|uniref:Uncharacterized protein n=1 Tax=Lysobacter dokdonensis DS-58 TaxID=1300345 RepID=A0A0A2WF05_9GAMM|nr:hypothetical protein [Lysobacter dokdonensis]KGQ18781.1 hypothetical protein LF41_314 [Lysobacter dokdonensis DS-58]
MTESNEPEQPQRKPPPGPPEIHEAWTRQDRGGDNTETKGLATGCGIAIAAVAVFVLLFIGICGPAFR